MTSLVLLTIWCHVAKTDSEIQSLESETLVWATEEIKCALQFNSAVNFSETFAYV